MTKKIYYQLEVAGLKRDLPLCPVEEDLYIAAFILFGDVELTKNCAAALLAKAPVFDVLLTAEAKGIPLLYEMARQSGHNDYIVARKGPKLYMQDVFTTEVDSITTDHRQILCIGGQEAAALRGKRVLLVDDVVSTGESLGAMERLVAQAGGRVAAKLAVLAEGDAIGRQDLIYLAPLPVFHKDGTPKNDLAV